MAGFTITIAGDSALNLEFAHAISAETSAKIRMAAENLTADPVDGITELVPTFCSLMVYYNPLAVSFDELSAKPLDQSSHAWGLVWRCAQLANLK